VSFWGFDLTADFKMANFLMRIITNVALEANAQWKELFADFQGKRAHHNTFDIHMIKLLSTEDTLPVIAEKCKYA
jgi:hypothetical protein